MTTGSTTRFPPSTPTSSRSQATRRAAGRRGLTLIELLITLGVLGILLALILPIVMSNRRVVQHDQARTGVNQTLRATNDLLAADVRIAGERFGLGLGLSPIEISTEAAGNSRLTLRRNLADALPVCETVSGTQTVIKVADWDGATTFEQCQVNGTAVDASGREWPATLLEHKQAADDAGGSVKALIYDPANGIGQWFSMSVPDSGTRPDEVVCIASAESACAWYGSANYAPDGGSALYSYIALIEETTYRVVDGVLERVDSGSGTVLRIASGVDRFNVRAAFSDGSVATEVGPGAPWREIVSLELDVGATIQEGREAVQRELRTSLFPRNLLSR